jgi:hypothetical protein
MESATRLDGARATQAEEAAAAAASDGSGVGGGSRGSFCVTRDELLVAVRLSVVCAVTAALLALPAGAGEFLLEDLFWRMSADGVDRMSMFRDVARMQRLEQFTVAFDWSTPTRRLQRGLASSFAQTVQLFFPPVCYVAYLGGSAKICRPVLGSALLAFTIALLGYAITASAAFLHYSPVLGFAMLIIALRQACPHNSKVPTQAIKQALVVLVGNVLILNVIPETGVRRSWRDSFFSLACTR